MSINSKHVQEIARLARIGVGEDDIPSYSEQLTKILKFMNEIQSINTDDVEPLAHPIEEDSSLRSDVVGEKDTRDNIQKCAPETIDGFYTVPQVIE